MNYRGHLLIKDTVWICLYGTARLDTQPFLRSYRIQTIFLSNTPRYRDAYMRQLPGPSSVPILICRLCGTKLLFEQMTTNFLLESWDRTSVKCESNRNDFLCWEYCCHVSHHLSFILYLQVVLKADNHTTREKSLATYVTPRKYAGAILCKYNTYNEPHQLSPCGLRYIPGKVAQYHTCWYLYSSVA